MLRLPWYVVLLLNFWSSALKPQRFIVMGLEQSVERRREHLEELLRIGMVRILLYEVFPEVAIEPLGFSHHVLEEFHFPESIKPGYNSIYFLARSLSLPHSLSLIRSQHVE
jgi:hypothetical protein